jgi:hypothetical protein
MQLATTETPAKVLKALSVRKSLEAGGKLKMEVGPEDELDTECPEGECWHVRVDVHVTVTPA